MAEGQLLSISHFDKMRSFNLWKDQHWLDTNTGLGNNGDMDMELQIMPSRDTGHFMKVTAPPHLPMPVLYVPHHCYKIVYYN
jgi:hypothetical protein